MSKMPEPEPVAWAHFTKDGLIQVWSRKKTDVESMERLMGKRPDGLITTTQAEAYAAAKVREALEEAIAAVESCRTTGTIRHGTVSDCIEAIRALLPSTPARPESEQ